MLSIPSVAQPWMPWGSTAAAPAGVRAGSPQLAATLPSVSYRMTGGEGTDCEPSCGSRPPGRKPRLTVMTWSCESMQLAPTMPVTHWRARPSASVVVGSGLGQKGSTRYSGADAGACASGTAIQNAPAAKAASSPAAGSRRASRSMARRLDVMAAPWVNSSCLYHAARSGPGRLRATPGDLGRQGGVPSARGADGNYPAVSQARWAAEGQAAPACGWPPRDGRSRGLRSIPGCRLHPAAAGSSGSRVGTGQAILGSAHKQVPDSCCLPVSAPRRCRIGAATAILA